MENYNWNEHRQIIDDSRATLERTSASIIRANQISVETENIGTEVLNELGEQRESLLRSRQRLQNVNEDLSQSNKMLKAIRRNFLYNKFILISIILLEAAILIGLIYIKFIRK